MKRSTCVIKAVVTRPTKPASPTPELPALEGNASVRAKAFLGVLRKNHLAFAELLPLQIEVNKVLHQIYPTIPHKIINMAVYFQTSCIGYLENIVRGFGRFTPDKIYVEDISDEDRERTATLLKQVRNKLLKQRTAKPKVENRSGNRPYPKVQYRSGDTRPSFNRR